MTSTIVFKVKFWNSCVSAMGGPIWHWTKMIGIGHSWPWTGLLATRVMCNDVPIETGVTLDVGVPSSRLVDVIQASHWICHMYHMHEYHDDVIKWKHFPRNWPFVRVNSPHKCQWRGALMFSLICVWINDSVNNRDAGDLRRYRAHHGVAVMLLDVDQVDSITVEI